MIRSQQDRSPLLASPSLVRRRKGDGDDGDDDENRFNSSLEFAVASVGFAVGVGSLWRFPFVVWQHGGGAFLVAYTICLLFLGIPLYFLELGLGLNFRCGAYECMKRIHPILAGFGAAPIATIFVICSYYNVILGWSLLYCVFSIWGFWRAGGVPWSDDPHRFYFTDVLGNDVDPDAGGSIDRSLEITSLRWPVVACLVACWLFVFASINHGVKRSGRVALVTVTLPYLLLAILFIRGVTLEGAAEGLAVYLRPKWGDLLRVDVWTQAAVQVLFSVGPCFGVLVAFGSYMPSSGRDPLRLHAVLIPFITALTGFFAGFVVFAVLGHLAHVRGVAVESMTVSGPSLAFVLYPTALLQLPNPGVSTPLFSFLFFFSLLLLGIDSVFAWCEAVVNFCEELSVVRKAAAAGRWWAQKRWITALLCASLLSCGTLFSTNAGLNLLVLLDFYTPLFSLMLVGLGELAAALWFYRSPGGGSRLVLDLAALGYNVPKPVFLLWKSVTPLLLCCLLVGIAVDAVLQPLADYSAGAQAMGWIFSSIPVLIIFAPCVLAGMRRCRR
jgi:SNF family Na+-dependent transporter